MPRERAGPEGALAGDRQTYADARLAPAEPATVAVEHRGVADVGEDAPHRRAEGATAPVETHAAGAAREQLSAEVVLERADAVGDGGGGDAEFLAGAQEALVARRDLEKAQGIEGRKGLDRFRNVCPHDLA